MIMSELLTAVLGFSGLCITYIFTAMVNYILLKDRRWLNYLLIWVVILISETVCFTLLPSQAGFVISFGDVTEYESGALISNFGRILLVHAFCMILAVFGFLWNVIRKRKRFDAKFLLLEVVICSICIFLGIRCLESEYIMHFESGDSTGKILLVFFGLIGFLSMYLGMRDLTSPTTAPQQEPLPSQLSPEEATARFDEIVAEKNRLTEKGDYVSQIPLLTEGTGLNLDVTRKARIWNYMGLAYRETDSADRALECFQTARQIDPDHPSSYMNIAMHCSDRREYDAALKNAEIAIEKAKQRGMSLGVFYADYAQITGLSGNLRKAKQYLRLAEKAGYDNNSIQKIQKQLGIRSLKIMPF